MDDFSYAELEVIALLLKHASPLPAIVKLRDKVDELMTKKLFDRL